MSDSQKYIARNRAPRVQIEYDVELYGAEKKIQLPFVMGVLSDLSGTSEQPPVADRSFLEIDVDNFDDRMRAMAPRAQFSVPNSLTGEGSLAVDLTFKKMSDFTPQGIAEQFDPLRPLLEARRQLTDLMAYMDGKAGAEALIEQLLAQPGLLQALTGTGTSSDDRQAALESLRAPISALDGPEDTTDDTLANLAAQAPVDAPPDTSVADALNSLGPAPEPEEQDDVSAALTGLRVAEMIQTPETDTAGDVLSGITRIETPEDLDSTADVLSALAEYAEDAPPPRATSNDILYAIARVPETEPESQTVAVLSGLTPVADAEEVGEDSAVDVLSAIDRVAEIAPEDDLDSIFSGIEPVVEPETAENDTGNVLSGIASVASAAQADAIDDILDALELPEIAEVSTASSDAVLSGIRATPETEVQEDTKDILAGLHDNTVPAPNELSPDDIPAATDMADPATALDDLDDMLAVLESSAVEATPPTDNIDLDALLAEPQSVAENMDAQVQDLDDFDALLSDFGDSSGEASVPATPDGLGVLLADMETPEPDRIDTDVPDDFADLLADLEGPANAETMATKTDDLEGFLTQAEAGAEDEPTVDDLDGLSAGMEAAEPELDGTADEVSDILDDLLDDLDVSAVAETHPAVADNELDNLDAMLADLDGDAGDHPRTDLGNATADSPPPQSPFGTISAARPERDALNRNGFRMAFFGDFTGRAARGAIETGDAMAARQPVILDVDTLDEVIEGFATTLTLPIGKNGGSVSVELSEIDDLHPDAIYEKLGIFGEISGLRQQLGMGSMVEKAAQRLKDWAEAYGTPIRLPKRSGATSIPAHMKLSDFQSLIGDTSGRLSKTGPADDLIAQIVGPHVVKAPDAGAGALADAVDQALSTAMRLVLHHPDFQAVEAQWRSLDLLARRIETNSDLQIVLYDVSAEELAADLAASEDLAESGIFRLLTDVLDPEEGAGGFSALFGLYTFEETPPHAELLARIGQVAAHVDAPFFTAVTPAYLDVEKQDRHPLVAKAWDNLRARREAAYLGLASPRFLLRRPYGAKTEPIDSFAFEEFSQVEGLKGMLWANPAVLVAILLAATYKKDGAAMDLGSVMSLGDIPFHFVTDRFGDQVALPCTERNLTTDLAQHTLARGFMPVIWVKGRDEIRLGSFRALDGEEISGPWSGATPAPRAAPDAPAADIEMELPVLEESEDSSLDDLLAGFDHIGADAGDDTGNDGDMDPELAAMLEGL